MIDIKLLFSGTGLKNFISSLVKGLQTKTDEVAPFYVNLFTRASYYNGRKMVLQKALNEIFALAVNSIRIESNRVASTAAFIYESSESTQTYFKESTEAIQTYVYESSEFVASAADFTVKIPVGIYTAALDRAVSAEVTLFKLAGKTFVVITY